MASMCDVHRCWSIINIYEEIGNNLLLRSSLENQMDYTKNMSAEVSVMRTTPDSE